MSGLLCFVSSGPCLLYGYNAAFARLFFAVFPATGLLHVAAGTFGLRYEPLGISSAHLGTLGIWLVLQNAAADRNARHAGDKGQGIRG